MTALGRGAGSDAQGKANELSSALDAEKQLTARALAQVEVLNQQIAALRRQLAALEEALDASEKTRQGIAEPASPISASGSTWRWRSACRNCRATAPTSSAGCAPSSATGRTSASSATASCSSRKCSSTPARRCCKPEGRAELDKLADRAARTGQADPARDRLGAAGRRPYRHAADRQPAVQDRTGSCRRRARSRWCNI